MNFEALAISPLTKTSSMIWSLINWTVRRIYPIFRKKRRLRALKVISVGNLQAGGSGKTPLVGYLAKRAIENKQETAILLRGYGSEIESRGGVIAPFQELVDPFEFGDEAALLHHWVPGAWIGVGSDRAMAYHRLFKELRRPFDVVLLDDGFQQFGLHKDFEILVLTEREPNEALFREFFSEAKLANAWVWTKGSKLPMTVQKLGYTGPCYRFTSEIQFGNSDLALPDLALNETKPASQSSAGLLVTGIGDSTGIVQSLSLKGAKIEKHLKFTDHHKYTPQQIESILRIAHDHLWDVFTTEKDFVKWKALGWDEEKFKKRGVLLQVLRLVPNEAAHSSLSELVKQLGWKQ